MQILLLPYLSYLPVSICLLSVTHMSLVCTIQHINDVFTSLKFEYPKLGHKFNAGKSEVLFFNWKHTLPAYMPLRYRRIKPIDHIIYLGLCIGFQ